MDVILAIILGVIQGLTEFIPVSSTGHLVLVADLFEDSAFTGFEFDVLLNIGTLTALLIYFRTRITDILTGLVRDRDYELALKVVVSTIPAAAIGYVASDLFSDTLRTNYVVAFMLIVVGLLMVYEERLAGKRAEPNRLDALLIGFAQALALIPGTSRSGATILAGRFRGLSAKSAAEYSFLIAIPIIFGAIVRVVFSSEGSDFIANNSSVVIIGNLASLVSGYLAIGFMLKFIARRGLKVFGYYRLGLGILVLLFTMFTS